MTAEGRIPLEERVLVLAPGGRDAQVIERALGEAGIACESCAEIDALCRELAAGAGAVIATEEALIGAAAGRLEAVLRAQPPWSDLAILVLAAPGSRPNDQLPAARELAGSWNVTVLERPGRVSTLLAAVRTALRARRRQYEGRALLRQRDAQVEELATERELRARFVSLLAHDLRGPLTAALLADDLVREAEDAGRRRDLAEKIGRNLQRIDSMLSDLLDVSRVHAGQPLNLRLEDCDLMAIARELADELNAVHGPRVVVDGPAEVRGVWSPDDIRRALWNLTTNALKYGTADAPVTVRLAREEGRVRIAVHNHGSPLSPADCSRVFEPFARARDAERSGSTGWGLGLTLVRGCAEAHGGRVAVASDAASGTTFNIELPVARR